MGVWKEGNSRTAMYSKSNGEGQKQDEESTYLKDVTVTFTESNGNHTGSEGQKKFWMPRARTPENTLVEFKNIESAKSHVKETLKKYSTILFALGAIAAFLSIIDSQITIWRRKKIFDIKETNRTLLNDLGTLDLYTGIQVSSRSAISILSVTTTIYLYIYYSHLHTLNILRNVSPRNHGFWFTKLAILFVFEAIICLVHIPPGVDAFPEEAQLIVFSRFYLIARFLKQKHKLMNSKSTRFLASVTKTDLSSVFLLKTYFMRNPFMLIIGMYLLTVIFGGYAVYLVEKEKAYVDIIWMLIVTMTTVGFGDFFPRTLIARAFTATIAVIGIFLMALCITLVHESLQLTQQEKRILAYVENNDHLRLVKDTAAKAIQAWWKYNKTLNKVRKIKRPNSYKRVKVTVMRSKMYGAVEKWRTLQSLKDEHWKKEFLGDNTAMLLTDVAREVKMIKEVLDEAFPAKNQEEDSSIQADSLFEDVSKVKLERQESRSRDPRFEKSTVTHGPNTVSVAHVNIPSGNEEFLETQTQLNDTEHILYDRLNQTRFHSPTGATTVRTYSLTASPNPHNSFKDIESAILLLQNQVGVMHGNLDEMYAKSKQELRDLESLVTCVYHVHRNMKLNTPLCPNCRMISQLRSSSC